MNRSDRREYTVLLGLLIALGVVLVATTIRGTYITDEINYMVSVVGLRQGVLTVPGTEKLPPSKELFSFDPEPNVRIPTTTPVISVVPPLYAPIALPFVFLGWRGLVLLNTISYLLTAFTVFVVAKRYATERQTPWLAAMLVLFGGYAIEYAQGVWPHMLSVLLVTLAVYVTSKIWDGGNAAMAVLSGLLMGFATGIREQNIILAGSLGLTLVLFARKKAISAVWYGIGVLVPLLVSATIHYYRQGLWHPFPKAIAITGQMAGNVAGTAPWTLFVGFWTKFVDFSALPQDYLLETFARRDPLSGAILIDGTVKKSLLQSCPWIALAFVVLLLAWRAKGSVRGEIRKVLRALSIILVPLIALFAVANRSDGPVHNQRYFLEMVPLFTLAVVLAFDGLGLGIGHLAMGALVAGLAFAASLTLPSHTLYLTVLMKLPLLLAALVLTAWMFRWHPRARIFLAVLAGLCFGWSLFAHVLDDLPASRHRRDGNASALSTLESIVPDHSAVFAYWGLKDGAGPLMLTRDVVILDVWADEGADATRLARELSEQRRRLFVVGVGFPETILDRIAAGDSVAVVNPNPYTVYEVVKRASAGKGKPSR